MNQNHISHREQPNIRIELSSQKYHPHKINEIFHKKKLRNINSIVIYLKCINYNLHFYALSKFNVQIFE